jgi:hypothetical protein
MARREEQSSTCIRVVDALYGRSNKYANHFVNNPEFGFALHDV